VLNLKLCATLLSLLLPLKCCHCWGQALGEFCQLALSLTLLTAAFSAAAA
jgi:hypothetical protein